jgi:hypothetical protein
VLRRRGSGVGQRHEDFATTLKVAEAVVKEMAREGRVEGSR